MKDWVVYGKDGRVCNVRAEKYTIQSDKTALLYFLSDWGSIVAVFVLNNVLGWKVVK